MSFGNNLKKIRQENNLTQEELAKKIVKQQWNALKEIDYLKKNCDVYNT